VARFRRRMSITKLIPPVHHADTLLTNTGGNKAPETMVVLDTEAGARTTTGGSQTIQVGQGTNEEVNVGATVKYINLFLQAAPRTIGGGSDDRNGWIEWALVMVKETETVVPNTNTGILTLGVICKHMFRNECIFTGAMPVGNQQPNYLEIKIKVPRFKQRITFGDQWRFITLFRDVKTTPTSSDTIRLVKSMFFKSYN